MYRTGDERKQLKKGDIVVLGVPFDKHSSHRRGASFAPARIREALSCQSSNMCTETGLDLSTTSGWHILPDIEWTDDDKAFEQIERELDTLLKQQLHVITLGGDHSITLPVIRAYSKIYPRLNILHFDAHPDLYDELDGNRYSHACPFARIMEERPATRLVQVGIRTLNPHQREQAERFGVEIIDMKTIEKAQKLSFDGPVYLSCDLDCLDPAYAPGVSHYEPGGMSTREVLNVIHQMEGRVIGADIVEYNPERDVNGMTGMVARKLLKEFLEKILFGQSSYEHSARSER